MRVVWTRCLVGGGGEGGLFDAVFLYGGGGDPSSGAVPGGVAEAEESPDRGGRFGEETGKKERVSETIRMGCCTTTEKRVQSGRTNTGANCPRMLSQR